MPFITIFMHFSIVPKKRGKEINSKKVLQNDYITTQ